MKNRKPFQLKNTLIVYNIVQIVLSVVLVIEVSIRYRGKGICLIYLTLCDLRTACRSNVKLEIYFNSTPFVFKAISHRIHNLPVKFLSLKFMFIVFSLTECYCEGFVFPRNNFFEFVLLQGLEGGWRKHYNFRCQPVDYSTNPNAMRVSIKYSQLKF